MTRRRAHARLAVTLAAVASSLLAGCRGGGPTTATIEAGRYDDAFAATIDLLERDRFPIERVDATRGVIATTRKRTAGLATPWDGEQRTLGQAWQDLLNDQSRAVRVTFTPITPAEGEGRGFEGPVTMAVRSTIYRAARVNVRTETEAVGLTTIAIDDKLARKQTYRDPFVPLRDDDDHAAWLTRRIVKRLAEGEDG